MLGRKAIARSHSELFRDELGQSYDHFKVAASHAPGGAAEFMTPPYDRARGMATRRWQQGVAVVVPMYETMKDGARNARSGVESRLSKNDEKNMLPTLLGLMAAGIALGAVAAMVVRRRRAAQEWDEFEPPSLEESGEEAGMRMSAATKKVASGAASMADTVSSRAGRLADSLRERAGGESHESFAEFADQNPTAEDVVARSGNQDPMP